MIASTSIVPELVIVVLPTTVFLVPLAVVVWWVVVNAPAFNRIPVAFADECWCVFTTAVVPAPTVVWVTPTPAAFATTLSVPELVIDASKGWPLTVTTGAVAVPVGAAVEVTRGELHPLLSSSLAMAVAGFFAGLCGYLLSRRPTEPDEPPDEEEEAEPPAVKIEWLLREPKRKWRIDPAFVRVLPVLAVSVGALLGAARLAPSEVALALLAVGLLGLAVAWVLYRQERRLDALERRPRG